MKTEQSKIFIFPCLIWTAVLSIVLYTSAKATPPDLVEYSNSQSGFLLRVEKAKDGRDLIVAYTCPAGIPAKSAGDCAQPGRPVLPVNDFKNFVRSILVQWAYQHPNQNFDHFSAEDLIILKNNFGYTEKSKVVARLKKEITAVDAKIVKAKNPAHFIASNTLRLEEINRLSEIIALSEPVENALNDLSNSIMDLILHNDHESNAPNSYNRAKMTGNLVAVVAEKLFGYEEWSDRELILTIRPGNYTKIQINPNGSYDVVIQGQIGAYRRFKNNDTRAVHELAEFIRSATANGQW